MTVQNSNRSSVQQPFHAAERLVDMFRVNFKRFAGEVDDAILATGPGAAG